MNFYFAYISLIFFSFHLSSMFAVQDNSFSLNTLMKVIQIIIERMNVRISLITETIDACENVTRSLHFVMKSSISVYNSEHYSDQINPFSKVNILCFQRDENFISFAVASKHFWRPDSYNIILVNKKPHLEYTRLSLSKNLAILPHTILIHEAFVHRIRPHDTSRLTINENTTIRDIFGFRNFGGRPMRVTQFSRLPEVMVTKSGHMGSSYNMLITLAKYLNFTPIVQDTSDGERFGDFVNGTFTGALGDIVYNKTDMVMNGNFLQEPLSDLYWHTIPVNFEQICVILQKAGQVPKYMTPFMCLSKEVWFILDATFIIVCCMHYFIARFGRKHMNFAKSATRYSILTTLSAMINIPLMKSRYRYPSLRVLLIVYLSFMLVFVSTFKASLVTLLSIPIHYPDIDTIDELKSRSQPLEFVTISKSIMKSFKRVELKDDKKLSDIYKYIRYVDPEDMSDFSGNFLGRFLYSQRRYVRDFALRSKKDNKSYTLHRVRQCPMRYYVAYLLPKNFPCVQEVNSILARVIEGGLNSKWDTDVVVYSQTEKSSMFKLLPSTPRTIHLESQLTRFSLEHLQTAFATLLFGWTLSVLTFLIELVVCRQKEIKN